jgi:hypothetical protein
MDHTRLKEMATAADQLVAMRAAPAVVAAVEADPGDVYWCGQEAGGGGEAEEEEAVGRTGAVQGKPSRQAAGLCLRHWRYGAQAFSCDGDCCWPGNGWAGGN